MNIQEFADEFIRQDDLGNDAVKWGFDNSRHFNTNDFFKCLDTINKKRKQQQEKLYQYLVTFTIDPKKHPVITQELEDKIISYLETQPDRPSLRVKECSYVRETHLSGMPHFHMKLICSGKPLRTDAFRQYNKIYGNTDISRSKHTNGQHIDNYLNKEGTVKILKK